MSDEYYQVRIDGQYTNPIWGAAAARGCLFVKTYDNGYAGEFNCACPARHAGSPVRLTTFQSQNLSDLFVRLCLPTP